MEAKKVKKTIIEVLFPKNIACLLCNKELSENTHYSMCNKCLQALPKNNGKTCAKCGEQINSQSKYCLRCKSQKPKFTQCFSPLLYQKPVTTLIKNFKYNNKRYYSETLGNFLVESYVLNNLNCDLVFPVPLHEKRQNERGFNQAELLANQLVKQLHIPISTDALKRVKHTQTQTSLTKTERAENVKKAFVVTQKELVKDRTILLVDDVYTTGSTLNECAKVLFKAGAKEVYCLTLAHTMGEKAI